MDSASTLTVALEDSMVTGRAGAAATVTGKLLSGLAALGAAAEAEAPWLAPAT